MKLTRIVFGLLAFVTVLMLVPVDYVQPELQPYVAVYDKMIEPFCEKKDYNVPNQVIMSIVDLPEDIAGSCIQRMFGLGHYIQIDKEFWEEASIETRMAVVAHELSHCRFDLDHSENPNNYMYKSVTYVPPLVLIEQVIIDSWTHCKLK